MPYIGGIDKPGNCKFRPYATSPPSSFGIVVPVAAGERGVLVVETVRRLSGWLWVRCAANGVSILVAAFAAGGRSAPRVSDRTARCDGSANSKRGTGKFETEEARSNGEGCGDRRTSAGEAETEAGSSPGASQGNSASGTSSGASPG